jgi:TPR repeat protein
MHSVVTAVKSSYRHAILLLIGLLPLASAMAADADDYQLPPSEFLSSPDKPLTPSASSTDSNNDDESNMDWSRSVVSRGIGGRSSSELSEKAWAERYQEGQTAYFFKRYEQAARIWQPMAESGFVDAQASLGWLYQEGLGIEKDLAQARNWYEQAAAQGHAVAQNNLGALYQYGLAVVEDAQQAMHWYRLSARQGYRFAQYNLAALLLEKRQHAEAKPWLESAASLGVRQARDLLQSFPKD